jgi:hypothetical protein
MSTYLDFLLYGIGNDYIGVRVLIFKDQISLI